MTLSHYLHLRSRTLTPAEARTLLQPIMEGVAQLHRSGLIHRGICPDNILLPIDGTARLTGYGTLALRTGGSELKSQLYPGYAAPEQYSAAEFSGRYTDVYLSLIHISVTAAPPSKVTLPPDFAVVDVISVTDKVDNVGNTGCICLLYTSFLRPTKPRLVKSLVYQIALT